MSAEANQQPSRNLSHSPEFKAGFVLGALAVLFFVLVYNKWVPETEAQRVQKVRAYACTITSGCIERANKLGIAPQLPKGVSHQ